LLGIREGKLGAGEEEVEMDGGRGLSGIREERGRGKNLNRRGERNT
jgi:hypothetical protein